MFQGVERGPRNWSGEQGKVVRDEVGEVAGWGREGLGGPSEEWAFIL